MKNAITVDLEDYYHVAVFSDSISAQEWTSRESRLERNTDRVLALLGRAGVKGTFFVLGWVAEHSPALVRLVAEQGHEIACHSYGHRRVYEMTPEEFRRDTQRAKCLIEDATGCAVRGYRAPSFSITQDSLWALDVLAELGFRYDSSIFPVVHFDYGIPDAPRFLHRRITPAGYEFAEFPPSTIRFAHTNAPIGGGAYLRMFPYRYTAWALERINMREGHPAAIYLHPWELDPEQPRVNAPFSARLRQYFGLRSFEGKLERLLRDFAFGPMGEFIETISPEMIFSTAGGGMACTRT